jgi:hypothetical protein
MDSDVSLAGITEAKRGSQGLGAVPAAVRETLKFEPQDGPQTLLVHLPPDIREAVLGGARGGGKTYGMLLDWWDHAATYGKHASGVFFRRTAKQLEQVKELTFRIFPGLGAVWVERDAAWLWVTGPAKGARLKFRHLWDDAAAANYMGHAYTWLCFEELTNWPTSGPIDKLRATLRSAYGVLTQFRATCNPGGPGHNWVKARYITPAPAGHTPIKDPKSGRLRVYIPARLEQNPALFLNDPDYEHNVFGSGPPHLVKAWRYGDWDIVAGGFFDDIWRPERHILGQFKIPQSWRWRRSFDWGSAAPSSLGIWAESSGEAAPDGRIFPRGSLVRVNEWYTVAKGRDGLVKPNEGLRLKNKDLGAGVAQRCHGRTWSVSVADPSIFTEQGGKSIYDQMVEGASAADHVLEFDKADNSRVAGWSLMRDMLEESSKETPESPGIWVFENCVEWLRTVPVLQRDERDLDDVDTKAEDHAGDETRYCVMADAGLSGPQRIKGMF